MKNYATADDWYANREEWQEEVAALRTIVLGTGLSETIKWRHPCYMDNGRNVVIVSSRKDHAIASLIKGALIKDPRGRLVQPGQDRSVRYMPFTSIEQIRSEQAYLETLIGRAIGAERAGLRVEPLPDDIDYVDELRQRMDTDDAFRAAFEALTPGRRRGYNIHFSKARQSSTRDARISRCTERIFLGKGLMDCVCGHSKRPPRCDGSHKHFE